MSRAARELRQAHAAVGTALAVAAYWQLAAGLLGRARAALAARPRRRDAGGPRR